MGWTAPAFGVVDGVIVVLVPPRRQCLDDAAIALFTDEERDDALEARPKELPGSNQPTIGIRSSSREPRHHKGNNRVLFARRRAIGTAVS